MSIELKIKAKHLALEPNIIKYEERRIKKQMRSGKCKNYETSRQQLFSLTNHRKFNVRNEARATHLARAFLSGKEYRTIEKKRKDECLFNTYIVPRIVDMANKYRWTSNNIDLLKDKIDSFRIHEWAK